MAAWKVTFFNVADAHAMSQKLLSSKFYVRHADPKSVDVQEGSVILQVPAVKDRQSMSKACAQTFNGYGTFTGHTIEYLECLNVGAAPAPPPAPAPGTASREFQKFLEFRKFRK